MDVGIVAIEFLAETGASLHEQAYDLLGRVMDTFHVALPVFLLVLLVTAAFRRWLAPWSRHLLWTLVLIRMVLPVSIVAPLSVQNVWSLTKVFKSISAGSSQTWILNVAGPGASTPNLATSDIDLTIPPTLRELIESRVWASLQVLMTAGVLLFAAATTVSFVRAFNWIRYSRSCSDQHSTDLLSDAQRSLGLGTRVRLRTIHQLSSPAIFDWFCASIFLPENFTSLPETHQELMFHHAVARLRRGDSGLGVLIAVVRILQWWNPLFWWTQHCWTIERELACDSLVVNQLDEEHKEEFIRLLDQFPTQLSRLRFLPDAPGLVSFISSESILRRRIKALPLATRFESRIQYWFAWFTIGSLAAISLTDAPKTPLQDYPIELPPGTIWRDNTDKTETSEELDTRTYDLTPCVERIRRDGPNWPEQSILDDLTKMTTYLLAPGRSFNVNSANLAQPAEEQESGSNDQRQRKCHLIDKQLVVRATPTQHDQIERILSERAKTGLDKQITVEVRTVSARMELREMIPAGGGQIFSGHAIVNQFDSPISQPFDGSNRATTSESVRSPLAVFVRGLTSSEAFFAISAAQGNVRTCMLFAPKVTLFNGTTGTVSCTTSRPFVTGIRNTPSGVEPIVTKIDEGFSVRIFVFQESDKIYLRIGYSMSRIEDVRQLITGANKQSVQVPQVREMLVESTVTLDDGESLLLAPLEREKDGTLNFMLITPRLIQMETTTDEE